jgi:hypothetical protein
MVMEANPSIEAELPLVLMLQKDRARIRAKLDPALLTDPSGLSEWMQNLVQRLEDKEERGRGRG